MKELIIYGYDGDELHRAKIDVEGDNFRYSMYLRVNATLGSITLLDVKEEVVDDNRRERKPRVVSEVPFVSGARTEADRCLAPG